MLGSYSWPMRELRYRKADEASVTRWTWSFEPQWLSPDTLYICFMYIDIYGFALVRYRIPLKSRSHISRVLLQEQKAFQTANEGSAKQLDLIAHFFASIPVVLL